MDSEFRTCDVSSYTVLVYLDVHGSRRNVRFPADGVAESRVLGNCRNIHVLEHISSSGIAAWYA